MSNEYLIENVSDFLKIPVDRLDDCLAEFGAVVKLTGSLSDLSDVIAKTINSKCDTSFEKFVWIDDGKKNQTLKIKTTVGQSK